MRTSIAVLLIVLVALVGAPTAVASAQADVDTPPRFAVGGQLAEGSIALLDANGVPIQSVGSPDLQFGALRSCPGTPIVVQDIGSEGLNLINAVTGQSSAVNLSLVMAPAGGAGRILADLACSTAGEPELRLLTESFGGDDVVFELWSVPFDLGPLTATTVVDLGVVPVALGGRAIITGDSVALLTPTETGERLELFTPGQPEPLPLATADQGSARSARFTEPAVGADGRLAIGEQQAGTDGSMSAELILVDSVAGRVTDRFEIDAVSELVWLSDAHLGVIAFGLDDGLSIDVYGVDPSSVVLTGMVGSVELWDGWASALVDDSIWGVRGSEVVQAPLGGSLEVKHRFAEPVFGPLLLVDPAASSGIALPIPIAADATEGSTDDNSPLRAAIVAIGSVGLIAALVVVITRRVRANRRA